jgi:hypothetical protein
VLLPASASKRQPNSPNSCLFPIYHYPQSRGITCLLDMKHSFFGLSQAKHEGHHVLSQLFDWLYLPHFLLRKWVVVKYSGVPLPGSFEISVQKRDQSHTHTPAVLLAQEGSCPCDARRLSHRTMVGAEPAVDQQLSSTSPTNNAPREGSCPCVHGKHAFVPRWLSD